MNLLNYRKNIFSQNGEDGVIEKIFEIIGTGNKTCCEFGAWDGIHLSNARNLIQSGWSAVLIEGDTDRYKECVENYKANPNVYCLNRFVDDKKNSTSNICKEVGVTELDFLSIDIDGLDYEIFQGLDMKPRVICIETSSILHPNYNQLVDEKISHKNVGQSLGEFTNLAEKKGFSLICFTGNAFYVRDDLKEKFHIISVEDAYLNVVNRDMSLENREYVFLMNIGLLPPYYKHGNRLLNRKRLGINIFRAAGLICRQWFYRVTMNVLNKLK